MNTAKFDAAEMEQLFALLERHPKSIYIQKLSSSTYVEDCNDLKGRDLPSHFGLSNGDQNKWRVKLARISNWQYCSILKEVFDILATGVVDGL